MREKQVNMFVFDCERMKYPHTGYSVFCESLADSLVRQAGRNGESLGLFVPERFVGHWGAGVSYYKEHFWNRFYLPCSPEIKVWHASYQYTHYLPPRNVRVVLTVHDLDFLYSRPSYSHGRYVDEIQCRVDRADSVVAVSESTKRDLVKNVNMRGKYVEVIYNGLNKFEGDEQPPVVKPDGEFLFSVGTVVPKKNFHVLPALLRDNAYRLIIAGNRSRYEHDIMDEARRWGVEDRVSIIGPVPEPVKYWYIRHCSAFLFPSVAEGFGLPVIEAMYYRKPIFLSDRTSLPEIAGDCAIYFDHEFTPDKMREEFAAGMERFRNGGMDTDRMVEHARSFSWERTARRYLEIYRELSD